MNKILKRLLTGVLTLATVFTALPTTAVHAAETQYWTESEERVGIVEKVMNDGSIGSTFNEGHMTVEGEDAYCIDINTGFKNGYKTRSDASTRMTAYQIEDVALSLEYVKEKTFGVLKFSALRREVHIQNEDGTVSEEIKERTYDLKCKEQGRMIQVSIPASVPLKEFDYNTEVEIINPVADTVATATFQGADVDWYIKADDIVLKNKNGQPAGNNHAPNNPQQPQHKK